MFLKFPTFRYSNLNRASKTKIEKSCYSSFLFILRLDEIVENPNR